MTVNDHSEISFSIPQGTLPWQPIFVVSMHRNEFRWHSVDGVSVRQELRLIRWTQAASGVAGRAKLCVLCPASSFLRVLSQLYSHFCARWAALSTGWVNHRVRLGCIGLRRYFSRILVGWVGSVVWWVGLVGLKKLDPRTAQLWGGCKTASHRPDGSVVLLRLGWLCDEATRTQSHLWRPSTELNRDKFLIVLSLSLSVSLCVSVCLFVC